MTKDLRTRTIGILERNVKHIEEQLANMRNAGKRSDKANPMGRAPDPDATDWPQRIETQEAALTRAKVQLETAKYPPTASEKIQKHEAAIAQINEYIRTHSERTERENHLRLIKYHQRQIEALRNERPG
jgi:hypothetical protein